MVDVRRWSGRRRTVWACLLLLAASCALLAIGAGRAEGFAGIDKYTTEPTETQAGGHPDVRVNVEMDNRVDLNQEFQQIVPPGCGCQDPEGLYMHFPTGFIGNPHAIPQCSLTEFALNECSPETQVGVVFIEELIFELGPEAEQYEEETGYQIGDVAPIYNLRPHPGEAGAIGAVAPIINVPIQTSLSARTGGDYGLDATTLGFFHIFPVNRIELYLWGNPADPSHDASRFPLPHTLAQARCLGTIVDQFHDEHNAKKFAEFGCHPLVPSSAANIPFLENPTSCESALTSGLDILYYDGTLVHGETGWPATTGCDQLSFNPSLTAKPTTSEADTPSGMDVDIGVPQPESPSVPSPSEIRGTTVTFPAGFSLSPNGGDGKTACADALLNFESTAGAECPEFSKIGTDEISSSALPGPITGGVYIGQPLPGQTFRIFVTADGFATHVKLRGSVHLDPQTGQIVTTFENLPQSPFQDFDLHFFGSERAIFATPVLCGTYPIKTEFVPWDSDLPVQTSVSSFAITSGPGGGPCPSRPRPFVPGFQAGTPDNTAGGSSPLTVQLTRPDGDQTFSKVTLQLPTGLIASLHEVTECPAATIAMLASGTRSGILEASDPSCPASSRVGTVAVASGAGTHQLPNDGRAYLAGPYLGAPLSIEIVVPAVGGPYDFGTVATRVAVFVNPATTQITAVSDPLPQIIEGVPLRVRSIQVNLDRPGFTRIPTNCSPKTIDASVVGGEGTTATPSAFYQVGNCTTLHFSPKLKFKLNGSTARTGHPSLVTTLTQPGGQSNIARAAVTLPQSEQIDNAHINSPCTRVEFAANACPEASIIGYAAARTPLLDEPLEGPVYLRSSSHELPDLVADLRGKIHVELDGRIDTVNQRIRTTFEEIPDAPVTSFTLTLKGGKRGLLVNDVNLCAGPLPARVSLSGQGGQEIATHPTIQTPCPGSRRTRRHHGR